MGLSHDHAIVMADEIDKTSRFPGFFTRHKPVTQPATRHPTGSNQQMNPAHNDTGFFTEELASRDPEIFDAIHKELGRQRNEIELNLK